MKLGDIMGYRDLYINFSYDSSEDDILQDFYIPVLAESTKYDRIAGYFSSSSLQLCSQGIKGLISNKGKMRLITSPYLAESDIQILNKLNSKEIDAYVEEILKKSIDEIDYVFRKGYWALAWMLSRGYLEIRLASMLDDNGKFISSEEMEQSGLFHQKIGIMYDNQDNWLAFSGSVNETKAAWNKNIEEFSVFRSWEESELKYAEKHSSRFEKYWNGMGRKVKIIDLPLAVKEHLIKRATDDCDDRELEFMTVKTDDNDNNSIIKLDLFDIQQEARDAWFKENNSGIIEMATGTGKTITAIACIMKLIDEQDGPLLTVIASPQNTISRQWEKETRWINKDSCKIVAIDGTQTRWRSILEGHLLDFQLGISNRIIIITSHSLLCSTDFIDLVSSHAVGSKALLVGDEVHALGAPQRRKGLIELYEMRLGLSATPDRLFDEEGTKVIRDYFGPTVYSFDIGKAQNTINPLTGYPYLVDYYYQPIYINLEEEELMEYYQDTQKLIKIPKDNDDNNEKIMERILFHRAHILKQAKQKLSAFEKTIKQIGKYAFEQAIIFTSPYHKDRVLEILKNEGIEASQYTEEENEKPSEQYQDISERQYLIKLLEKGYIKSLVAIKCLDEGIDIPSARIAFLMASSQNPREYIQRIGRVIRRHKDKKFATIYDMVICPSGTNRCSELQEIENRIFIKEKKRVLYLLNYAKNGSEVLQDINRR